MEMAMTNFIKNFWRDEEGATAIEYGLIAGLIAVALIATITALGTDLGKLFGTVSKELQSAVTKSSTAVTP